MLKTILAIGKYLLWLVVRIFKRRDTSEPQKAVDQARTDAATGNDRALNADLDAAADRMRNPRP